MMMAEASDAPYQATEAPDRPDPFVAMGCAIDAVLPIRHDIP